MELWIRSQDRTEFVKIDNISYINVAEDMDTSKHILWNDCREKLAQYNSKERALEVLDEIQKYKDKLEKAWFLGMTESTFVSSTYEMPEE